MIMITTLISQKNFNGPSSAFFQSIFIFSLWSSTEKMFSGQLGSNSDLLGFMALWPT